MRSSALRRFLQTLSAVVVLLGVVRAADLDLPPPGAFTIVVIPDTQGYMSAGPLRLYRFLPQQNKVQVITYDTTKRELVDRMVFVPDRTQHQFMLDYAMTRPEISSR